MHILGIGILIDMLIEKFSLYFELRGNFSMDMLFLGILIGMLIMWIIEVWVDEKKMSNEEREGWKHYYSGDFLPRSNEKEEK
jgi:hypothetical protein